MYAQMRISALTVTLPNLDLHMTYYLFSHNLMLNVGSIQYNYIDDIALTVGIYLGCKVYSTLLCKYTALNNMELYDIHCLSICLSVCL